MDFGSFGDQRSLRMLREQFFLYVWGANFWILDAPVATFGQHIIDLGGRRGAPGGFLEALLASTWGPKLR